jgi:hypothetical protein
MPVCPGAAEVFSALQQYLPKPRETIPASQALSISDNCEAMRWEGFTDPGMKARLAQGLEGTQDAKGTTSGGLELSSPGTRGMSRPLDGQELNAEPNGDGFKRVDSGPQWVETHGETGPGAGALLAKCPAGAATSGELAALDMSEWGVDWSWRDRPEFKPAGEQPQGWRWVLARLRALAVEERGPWLRTLTWQDRVMGCVQQVC